MKEDLKCKHHNIYVVRRDNSVDITCQWCRDCGAFKFSREEWDFPTRPSEKMELDEKKLRNFINEQEIPLNNLYGDGLAKAICRTFSHPQVKLPKKFVCCCKHISGVGEVKCICGASYFNAALDKVREMNGLNNDK